MHMCFSILSVSRGICIDVFPARDKAIRRQVGMISVNFPYQEKTENTSLVILYCMWIVFLLKNTYQVGVNT